MKVKSSEGWSVNQNFESQEGIDKPDKQDKEMGT
jgi:hypothetical protein